MSDLEIKFKVTKDGEGGKEVQQEIDKVTNSAKQAAPEMDKAGKAAQNLGDRKRALQAAARGVALELPLVGRVLGFLASPLTVVTALVSVAAGKFLDWKRSIEEAG